MTNPGIEPKSSSLQVDSLPAELPGKPNTNDVDTSATKRESLQSGIKTKTSC